MYTDKARCTIFNMRMDKNPLVLVNTLFKVTDKDTNIKGYWLDDKGQLYIDNIELKEYGAIDSYYFRLEVQRMLKTEKCIFYKDFYNNGIIEYQGNKQDTLRTRLEFISNIKPSEARILELVKEYSGCTLYTLDSGCYVIEVYK